MEVIEPSDPPTTTLDALVSLRVVEIEIPNANPFDLDDVVEVRLEATASRTDEGADLTDSLAQVPQLPLFRGVVLKSNARRRGTVVGRDEILG